MFFLAGFQTAPRMMALNIHRLYNPQMIFTMTEVVSLDEPFHNAMIPKRMPTMVARDMASWGLIK